MPQDTRRFNSWSTASLIAKGKVRALQNFGTAFYKPVISQRKYWQFPIPAWKALHASLAVTAIGYSSRLVDWFVQCVANLVSNELASSFLIKLGLSPAITINSSGLACVPYCTETVIPPNTLICSSLWVCSSTFDSRSWSVGKSRFLVFCKMIETAAPVSTSMESKEPFSNISTTMDDDDPIPIANMLSSLGATLPSVDTHLVGRQLFLPGFFLEGFCP